MASRYDDAPPLAKLILDKVEKLEDYQKDKIRDQLEGDEEISSARMTVLLRSTGITSTASQLRALSTYFNGSNGGVPRTSVLDMIKEEEDLDDARASRHSADTSYAMLQRLKNMRGSQGSTTIKSKTSNPIKSSRDIATERQDSIDSESSDIGLMQSEFSAERLEFLKQATMATRENEQRAESNPPNNDGGISLYNQ